MDHEVRGQRSWGIIMSSNSKSHVIANWSNVYNTNVYRNSVFFKGPLLYQESRSHDQ
jgi:hypothetical protein